MSVIGNADEAFEQSRLYALKQAVGRLVEKREKAVLAKLVRAYRDNELNPEMAYANIMLIAELRSAEGDIGKADLY